MNDMQAIRKEEVESVSNRMPSFIIAGERRCGTTSLYHLMTSHPDIYMYPNPDMNYFIEEEISGTRVWRDGEADPEAWTSSHSKESYSALFKDGASFAAVGHKGADLFFWKQAHARLAEYLPETRFIITLRDPVSRAWSHYWNEVGKGRETLSFEDAIAAEEERSRRSAYARLHLSYLARGFYDLSLREFFRTISPSRVLVVTVEERRLRPAEKLDEIYRFVGVKPREASQAAVKPRNENWTMVPRDWAASPIIRPVERAYNRVSNGIIVRMVRDPEKRRKARRYVQRVFRRPATSIPMPENVRARLTDLYAPHIEALESMLDRKFPEWRS